MVPTKRNRDKRHIEEMRNAAGDICVNCGSKENIEYHHIVPLFLGGRDIQSNIVPLCYKCHKAAHHGRHLSEYRDPRNKGGRKTKVSDEEAFRAFDLFASGEIGRKKCKELIQVSKSVQIKSRPQYIKYLEENGIESIKNNIDIVATNSELKDGMIIGEIVYLDGNRKMITYKDTGKNNIQYTHRKNHHQNFKNKLLISDNTSLTKDKAHSGR